MLNADVIFTCKGENDDCPHTEHAAKVCGCNADGTHNLFVLKTSGKECCETMHGMPHFSVDCVEHCPNGTPGTFCCMDEYAALLAAREAAPDDADGTDSLG